MNRLARQLVTTVGAFGSLVALAVSLRPPGQGFSAWQVAWITLSVAFGVLALILDIRYAFVGRPKLLKGPEAIRNYMYQWIVGGSRVAIFTRDMSWVSDDEMTALLRAKAQNGELTLVLPKSIALSDSLRDSGAEVVNYPDYGYTVRSRFTIVNLERADERVAIGRTEGDQHLVEELSAAGKDPASPSPKTY